MRDHSRHLDMVKHHGWRVVHKKRIRVLQKRGEYVMWSDWFNAWIWKPETN